MEQVVEEALGRIPHLVVVLADAVHRVGDPEELLDEAEGEVLIYGVLLGQDERNLQHAQAVERHPCGAVGLVQMPSGRQLRAAIEDSNVDEPEKAARKYIAPVGILAVDPPV